MVCTPGHQMSNAKTFSSGKVLTVDKHRGRWQLISLPMPPA
jgi:hypothetical protein